MRHNINDLPVGTSIYYTGDMANPSGVGVIIAQRPANKWAGPSVDMTLEDGREIKGIYPCMFDKTPGQRFYTMQEWNAKRDAQIAEMRAHYGQPAL